jgi:hypothetical protein
VGEQDRPAIADPVMEVELPCVVSAVKLGASSLMRSDIVEPPCAGFPRRRIGVAVQKSPASAVCYYRSRDRFYDAVVLAMPQAGEPSPRANAGGYRRCVDRDDKAIRSR